MDNSDLNEDQNRWALTSSELNAVTTKNPASRLAFAVQLTFFRNAGRFPKTLTEIESEAIASLSGQLGVDAKLRDNPELDRTTRRHRAEIRRFFGFHEATVADGEELMCWLRDHVVSGTRDDDKLATVLLEECRRRCIEPPGRERFDRMIRSAIHAYEDRFYAQTVAKLAPRTRAKLDLLLQPEEGEEKDGTFATLTTLREGAGRSGVNSIRDEMAKLDIIRTLELPANLFDHASPHELELYRQRVAVEAPYELRRHPEAARLTWLAAFAHVRGRTITDTLTDLLVDTIHRINAKADRRVTEALVDDLKRVSGKMNILYTDVAP